MKINKNMFSLIGSISKYMALANIGKVTFSLRNITAGEAFHSISNCQEKLQIIYANIRV
ncbi:hypothetical protein [Flavobacterium album]|uniref:hypothetical protein n=1 Tax=Flavobacterium album TaxID=2175091 RepID=UPI0015E7F6FC|nr:hypothetical protein [Flavobacterium album]